MTKVADILLRKGNTITTIDPQATVLEALRLMAEKNIGSVVVLQNDVFAGIMTERDYSRKVILNGKNSTISLVAEIMSTDLPRVAPNDSIENCMELMSSNNIRYIPVFEAAKLTGIISMSDVVKATIHAQKETINQLENYIQS